MKIRITAVFVLLSSCIAHPQSLTMSHGDYMSLLAGRWYEVALFPSDLRKGCHCTTLEFEYIPDRSYLTLTLRCILFKNQKSRIINKSLKLYEVADTAVSMFKGRSGMFTRDYYRVGLINADSSMLVIINPRHGYIHVLSRDAFVPLHKYNDVLKLLTEKGYDASVVQKTSQNCDIID